MKTALRYARLYIMIHPLLQNISYNESLSIFAWILNVMSETVLYFQRIFRASKCDPLSYERHNVREQSRQLDKMRLMCATKAGRIFRWKSRREYPTYRAWSRERRCAHVRGRAWNSLSSPRTDIHDFYGTSRRRAILSDINGSRLDKWAGRGGTREKTGKILSGLFLRSANDASGL